MSGKKETSPRLGRGLAALLGDMAVQTQPQAGTVQRVPLDLLEPNPFQPRSTMDPTALDELAQSIRVQGVLQPLLVRPHPVTPGRFQIVAGERRWRAASTAGLHEVPTLVRDMADTEAAAVALVENLQRQDLNPIDEAEGYDRLLNSVRSDAGSAGTGRRQVPQPRRQYPPTAEPASQRERGRPKGGDLRRPRPRPVGPS